MKRLHIALIYNAYQTGLPELPEDRAGLADLRRMIRLIARALRSLGHTVTREVPYADMKTKLSLLLAEAMRRSCP